MKAPVVFGSFLAVAGTAITSERADAAISNAEIVNDGLKAAICSQDWFQAIELSGQLIISPKVSPDYRQKLLTWRNHFYTYVKGNERTDEVPSCEELQASSLGEIQRQNYEGAFPRFSSTLASSGTASTSYCATGQADAADCESNASESVKANFVSPPSPTRELTDLWTIGVRIEGNRIRGQLLNNGWNTFRNVKLIIRSQKLGNSTDVTTVALDTVRAWSETEFVAAFSESPSDWIIERIEVN